MEKEHDEDILTPKQQKEVDRIKAEAEAQEDELRAFLDAHKDSLQGASGKYASVLSTQVAGVPMAFMLSHELTRIAQLGIVVGYKAAYDKYAPK